MKSPTFKKREQIYLAIKENAGKLTPFELAEMTGATVSTVREIASKYKISLRQHSAIEKKKRVLDFVKKNFGKMLCTEMAREMCCSNAFIHHAVVQLGLKRPKKAEQKKRRKNTKYFDIDAFGKDFFYQ